MGSYAPIVEDALGVLRTSTCAGVYNVTIRNSMLGQRTNGAEVRHPYAPPPRRSCPPM